MKVCVLSESSADEAAIRILVDGIRGESSERIEGPPLRSRGWPAVFQVLPSAIKKLHYHTDANALVVVVDSDQTPVHVAHHDEPGKEDDECRLCVLRKKVAHVRASLSPIKGRSDLQIALGLAVPSIEAWYLCGKNSQVGEAIWMAALPSRKPPYTRRDLKQEVYGNDTPDIDQETSCAKTEAARLVKDLGRLEKLFPQGFGTFSKQVRSWEVALAS
jgi:hypothetical protein